MQTLAVNGYDMAYLEIGSGRPLVCVHGTLGDFRTWSAVFGPLSKNHRVISVSLRRFFPEHWDGIGDDYLMAQHVADVIGFLEKLGDGPVDLMGHSRGGHIAFRVAQLRPDLLRKLVLAEPGGELDATLDPAPRAPRSRNVRRGSRHGRYGQGRRRRGRAEIVLRHDRGRRRLGAPARRAQAAIARQRLHPDRTGRREPKTFSKAEAQSIRTPTLFIGGADTKGSLPAVLRALAAEVPGARTAMIPGCGHWMFEQAPQEFFQRSCWNFWRRERADYCAAPSPGW